MNKKATRIIALALVVIMIFALVASMIVPYVSAHMKNRWTAAAVHFLFTTVFTSSLPYNGVR